MINAAAGKDTHMIKEQLDHDSETAAARRLAEALDPSAIDALLADAKALTDLLASSIATTG